MKRFFLLYFFLLGYLLSAQTNQGWVGHFSYNNIQAMAQSSNRMYAAAESAMFSKSTITFELKTTTSIDGLKPETITAVHYSNVYDRTLVGSSNGLLIVVNGDDSIVNKVDIIEETTVPAGTKKINHIYEHDGKAYISCDFGIAVLDLQTLEFDDTYYLGPNGAEVAVNQATVLNGYIYAATENNGIRRGFLNNPNLNDFSQWTEVYGGNWNGIVSFSNTLFAADNLGTVYRLDNGAVIPFNITGGVVTDLRVANNHLVITNAFRVIVYDDTLVQLLQVQENIFEEDITFTTATVVSGQLFIGTQQQGVIETFLNNTMIRNNVTPDGPLLSNVFSIEKTPTSLWVVFGSYSYYFTPDYLVKGISKLTREGWVDISKDDVFSAASISDIIVNPNNESEVYASSYHNGLLRIEDDVPVQLYDDTNSPLENQQAVAGFDNLRVNSLAYDDSGALWMTNDMTEKPLKVFRNGSWSSYDFTDVLNNATSNKYQKMVIDRNGTKWIPSINEGLIAFNETLGDKFIMIGDDDIGNLPSEYVRSLAIDNSNRLWIGTSAGLRVMPGIDRFLTENILTTNAIIIEEDGLAQELLYEQDVTDIEVDGSNNKWLATSGAGAFLVSPNGQSTLFHFTKENSPLPSNTINDIDIDNATGDVYFATDRGLVVYKGTSTEAAGDLSNVYVFPNPVRPDFNGDVNISGLIDNANIKITDISGNLVYETTSEGGTVLWDTRAFGSYKVASGVYMIFIASEDGTETKVKKVMIIR